MINCVYGWRGCLKFREECKEKLEEGSVQSDFKKALIHSWNGRGRKVYTCFE